MTIGRILANDNDLGIGFALAIPHSMTTRIVLTAKHVVGDQEPSSLQFVTQDGRRIPVERVEPDKDLDVAVLHLGEDVPEGLAVGSAVDGASWQVETQPGLNDPELSGIIDTTHRPLVKQEGRHEIYVLQLRVAQVVGDYAGYSGSPVVLPAPSGAVIGILDEQFPSRLPVPPGQPISATNVLYAIPIQAVLDRFGLTPVSPFPSFGTHSTQTLSSIRFRYSDGTITSPPLVLHEWLIKIGRSPRINIIVLPEEDVSWEHGQIVLEHDRYVYQHLSTSPKSARTILRGGGREFRPGKGEEAALCNHDCLIIGKTTFIVEFDLINEDPDYKPTADSPEDHDDTQRPSTNRVRANRPTRRVARGTFRGD
jgi:hypothetical protein